MIKNILFLLFFLNGAAFAKDYSYVSFFESNQVRTGEELLGLQGKTEDFLNRFYCTVFSDDLFSNDFQKNPKSDSLKILSAKGEIITYSNEVSSKGDFSKRVIKALQKLEASSIGRSLVQKLKKSPYPLWIKSGGNRFDPRSFNQRPMFGLNEAGALSTFKTNRLQVDRLEFKTWGSGGFVLWNSKKEYESMESDGISRKTPTYIALGHELYHAYDSIRGFLDRRMIKGEGLEFQPVIEYRAVYFENLLRAEAGRKYRKYYSPPSKKVIGSMLNEKGEPIFIPTDCL
jgi:hypothetical protein